MLRRSQFFVIASEAKQSMADLCYVDGKYIEKYDVRTGLPFCPAFQRGRQKGQQSEQSRDFLRLF
jgi:hypothetical protein